MSSPRGCSSKGLLPAWGAGEVGTGNGQQAGRQLQAGHWLVNHGVGSSGGGSGGGDGGGGGGGSSSSRDQK